MCVYVCTLGRFFLLFFSAVEKCGEWAKKFFALFFLFYFFFFSALINGCRRVRQINFLFFFVRIQSERKKREERRREKKTFSFFLPHWFNQSKIRSNPPHRSHLIRWRHLLISVFFNTFHFFLFYSVIMRFYIQIEGLRLSQSLDSWSG